MSALGLNLNYACQQSTTRPQVIFNEADATDLCSSDFWLRARLARSHWYVRCTSMTTQSWLWHMAAPLALAPSVRLAACAFLHVKLTIQMHIAVILPLPAFFSPSQVVYTSKNY